MDEEEEIRNTHEEPDAELEEHYVEDSGNVRESGAMSEKNLLSTYNGMAVEQGAINGVVNLEVHRWEGHEMRTLHNASIKYWEFEEDETEENRYGKGSNDYEPLMKKQKAKIKIWTSPSGTGKWTAWRCSK